MPRRRPAPAAPTLPQSDVPLVILIGPVVGVHGDDLLAAADGWRRLRAAWVRRMGLDRQEANRLIRAGGPVEGERRVARLARHGLDADALPALRHGAGRQYLL